MEIAAETRLNVTRAEILKRGEAGCCVNCGRHSLFSPGSLRIHESCPICGLVFDPGGGFWLGPIVINYSVSALVVVCPLLVLGVRDVIPMQLAIALAVVGGGFGVPLLLYRQSWSWWLMIWYFFFPYRLPENFAAQGRRADD